MYYYGRLRGNSFRGRLQGKTNSGEERILKIGNLKEDKKEYKIKTLNLDNIESSIELQNNILHDILGDIEESGRGKRDTQTLIHINSKSDFKNKMSHPNLMLGVFVENKLIAQLCLTKEEIEVPNHLSNLIEFNNMYTVGGVLSHPHFRGNGLMRIMLSVAIEYLKKKKVSGLFAEVDIANGASFCSLVKDGFVINDAYIDPSDGGKTYRLFRPLQKEMYFDKNVEQREIKVNPNSTIEELNKILSNGYCGVLCNYNKETKETTIIVRNHIKYLDKNINTENKGCGIC